MPQTRRTVLDRFTKSDDTTFTLPMATSSPVCDAKELNQLLAFKKNELMDKHQREADAFKYNVETMYHNLISTLPQDEIFYDISEPKHHTLEEFAAQVLIESKNKQDDTSGENKENKEEHNSSQLRAKSKKLPKVKASKTRKTFSRSTLKESRPKRTRPPRSKSEQRLMYPPTCYTTPIGTRPNYAIATVTPGPKINAPTTIFRNPQAGELAISLSGSPLTMVPYHGTGTLNAPQITIPLNDGRVMAILPKEGLRPEDFPDVNSETIDALKLLHDFIGENVLKYSAHTP